MAPATFHDEGAKIRRMLFIVAVAIVMATLVFVAISGVRMRTDSVGTSGGQHAVSQ